MKLILFDFDGVLVDTLVMHHAISQEVNKDLSLDEFRDLFNGNIFDSVKNSLTVKQHPRFFERFEEESRELKIPKSLKDSIHRLNKDYILAIVSATPSSLIAKILKQADSYEYFSDILGGDIHTSKVIKNKMLLEKYEVASKEAVYITDTVGDVIEARECGVQSIAVTWGFHEIEALKKAKPAKIVSTPEDLVKAIKEISNG